MRFKVPQFIEYEAKIFGPLTFKQFAVVGSAGLIVLLLFFTIGDNFFLWLLVSGVVIGTALSLVFIKVEGITLITLIGKSIGFFAKPRVYVWKRKAPRPTIISKKEEVKEEETVKSILKKSDGSRLRRLSSEIEIK